MVRTTYKGISFLMDLEDVGTFLSKKWAVDRGYLHYHHLYFHRVVLGAKKGDVVDHINRDKTDNRKENLRLVDYSTNALNAKKRNNKNGASTYKGVSKAPRGFNTKPWRARITLNGKEISLGYFETEEQAGLAYIAYSKNLGI